MKFIGFEITKLGKSERKELEILRKLQDNLADWHWLEYPFLQPFILYVTKQGNNIEYVRDEVRMLFRQYLLENSYEKVNKKIPDCFVGIAQREKVDCNGDKVDLKGIDLDSLVRKKRDETYQKMRMENESRLNQQSNDNLVFNGITGYAVLNSMITDSSSGCDSSSSSYDSGSSSGCGD